MTTTPSTEITELRGVPQTPVVTHQPTTASSLSAVEVSAWFGDHKVLEGLNLEMNASEVTALIGPSGCGKSTFIRILNRMHELVPGAALSGSVQLDGVDIYGAEQRPIDTRDDVHQVSAPALAVCPAPLRGANNSRNTG